MIRNLAGILCLACSLAGQASWHDHTDSDHSPEQLAIKAESYESFLRAGTGTPQSRAEVQERLGAVYYLLHRYHDSLDILATTLGKSDPSISVNGVLADRPLAAQSWLVTGLDYLELNQLPEATRALRRSLAIQPDSANARLALGDALARSGRMQDAESEFEEQTRRTPSLADAWYKLGLAHSQISVELSHEKARSSEEGLLQQLTAEELLAKGDNLNAARTLFRILRNTPNQPEVHADLGNALLRLGYVKAAQDHFTQELAVDPESPSATLGLVQTDAVGGRWDEVAAKLEQLSESHPQELIRLLEFPPAGIVLQSSGNGALSPPESFLQSPAGLLWKSWLSDSEVVARISEKSASACPASRAREMQLGLWMTELCYSRLATRLGGQAKLSHSDRTKLTEAEFRLGQYRAALNSAMHLLASDPRDGWGIYWSSKAHDAIAEECFLKVGALNPDSARVHQMLAEHYAKLADYPKAKAEFQNAIRLAPDSPDLHLGLGTVLSRAGELAEAEKELKSTIEVSPKSAFARYQLGHVYVLQNRWAEAIAELRQVPDDTTVVLSARLDLAKAESEVDQTSQAIKDLLSVAALDQDGELYFRLAALYRRSGDEAHAHDALATFKQRRAASLQTDNEELSALEKEQETGQISTLPSPR